MTDVAGRPGRLPGSLQSRYRMGRVLGSGAMSTVYLAHDSVLERDVAIKVFAARVTTAADLRAQQAEAQLIASLNHHALTTLFDVGVDASDPGAPQVYLVMEHIPGADLRQRLAVGALTEEQVCWLGFDLAEGLDHVHESGFLHRDIKPANVLLADRRASTRIRGKLADFGISSIIGRREDGEFTTGTAAYLSPEQVEGGDATPESDVYALGLVLIEALVGRTAYPGGVAQSAFARLEHQPQVPEDAPEPLAALLLEMTARHPADRPALRDVSTRFQRILYGGVLTTRPALPAPEGERVAAVRRYEILDTPAEDAFDAVTRLAVQVLHVPIAIVTIIDEDRVWFKSKRGIEVDEVDRNVAFCTTTDPGHGGTWAVPDVLADARLQHNPLVVAEPRARSYAAAPLITRDGHHLGALCVFDRRPREFQPQELTNLADLAAIVMRELELRLSSRRALFHRA